jgi:hypothetical protein
MRLVLYSLAILLVLVQTAPAQTPAQTVEQAPKSYDCYRTPTPIQIDGKLDDKAWKSAPWTTDFLDITGPGGPKPRFRTRIKLLWDATYLYIAAELEEPDLKATLTQHDSTIYRDNDFELFLKPPVKIDGEDAPGYFEFEINALNTSWDLYLSKPYSAGGKPDSSWNIPGLKTAVHLNGTLNKSTDKDHGWTVEIAIPWTAYATAYASRQPAIAAPIPGSQWRANFSRVEWPIGVSSAPQDQVRGQHKEDNWVWTPQYKVNMHIPEHWGYLNFKDKH